MADPTPTGSAGIPVINFTQMFLAMHTEYVKDFVEAFKIGKNGAIHCKNSNIAKFQHFITKYTAYFRDCEMVLNNLVLEPAGQADIETVNDNKEKVQRLYGAAYQLYVKSCRFLDVQPSPDYSMVTLIKIEQ